MFEAFKRYKYSMESDVIKDAHNDWINLTLVPVVNPLTFPHGTISSAVHDDQKFLDETSGAMEIQRISNEN